MVNATHRPLYTTVKRHDTHCSTLVGLGTGLNRYWKYHLNYDLNTESSSTLRVAIPNTLPQPPIFKTAINHLITKLIPCYQKAEL